MSSADFEDVPEQVDVKDRHVAAAALALRHAADRDTGDDEGRGYDVILLADNVKDFAKIQMARLGVRVLRPGQFLEEAFHAHPQAMSRAVSQAANELRKPPYTLAELLHVLGEAGARRLVAGLGRAFQVKPVAKKAQ